ncbi:AI-2E family transporter [Roseobacter sp. HKCCA0434]|uniref:AI-2E family transporter n=1 Tax=Roseobacter sp. HKCCA0434 TaxID=3079297 RepID=UPI0029058950|nr:AI-2E family transporter [Roseobacter sp. HKCCA0434]
MANDAQASGSQGVEDEHAQAQMGPAAAMPIRLPSVFMWSVGIVALILAIGALAAARAFLIPVMFAALLALVFRPVRRGLNKIGLSNGAAAFVITALLMLAIAGLFAGLAQPVSKWIADAPRITAQIETKLESLQGTVEAVSEAARQIDDLADGNEEEVETPGTVRQPQQMEIEVSENDGGILSRIAATAPLVVGQIVFTLALLFFVLASGDLFQQRMVEAMPRFRDKRKAVRIAADIERRVGYYLFTITLVNAALGVAIGLAMWAFGMPDPLLFGVVAFVLNFMPYIGAIIGTVSALAVGIVALPDIWLAVFAAGAYMMLTTIEGQFITPYFVGRSLKLNPVVVFLSVAFWAWLWSVVGMIVAVPILVVMRVFSEHIPALNAFGSFLAAEDAEKPIEPDK